MGTKLKRIFRN